MGRVRARSRKSNKQSNKRIHLAEEESDNAPSTHELTTADQTDQSNNVSESSQSSSQSSINLFSFSFLLQSVIEFLDDEDFLAKLLVVNQSVKQLVPQYSLKEELTLTTFLRLMQRERLTTPQHAPTNRSIKLIATRIKMGTSDAWGCDIPTLAQCGFSHIRLFDSGFGHHGATVIKEGVTEAEIQNQCHWNDISVPQSLKKFEANIVIGSNLSLDPSIFRRFQSLESLSVKIEKQWPIPPIEFAAGMLPNSLKSFVAYQDGLVKLASGSLPSSLRVLSLAVLVFGELQPGDVPSSLTKLELVGGGKTASFASNLVPDSVTELICELSVFMHINPKPSRLTHLTLRVADKLDVGIVPDTVVKLTVIGMPLIGAVPSSVTHLKIAAGQESLEVGIVPSSVTHLEIVTGQLTVPKSIPSSVTHLALSLAGSIKPDVIPTSVKYLTVKAWSIRDDELKILPDSITHMVLFKPGYAVRSCRLPNSLTHLCLSDGYGRPECNFPRSVTHFVLGSEFSEQLRRGDIPDTVTHLAFGKSYDRNLTPNNLPKHLVSLEVPRRYIDSRKPRWLPPTLTHVSYKWKHWTRRPEFAENHWSMNGHHL